MWLARENCYDAMVLDVMLPALSDELDEAECGADDWVTKPFSHVALVEHVKGPQERIELVKVERP